MNIYQIQEFVFILKVSTNKTDWIKKVIAVNKIKPALYLTISSLLFFYIYL